MLQIAKQIINRYAYTIFLVNLVFWVGFLPLFEITGHLPFIEFILINVTVITSYHFFYHDNKKILGNIVVPLSIILAHLNYFFPGNYFISQSEKILILLLFILLTIHFLKRIIRHKYVDKEVIIISISGYILIGLMASILCWFTANLYPGAYNIQFDDYGPIQDFNYYSIVTLSTLGYGDITPQIPQSKSLAIVITLVGQFYMTVLMAFLIGKFLNQRK